MKISANLQDPNCDNTDTNYIVLLDGVEIDYVIAADDEKGEILCYKQNPDGMIAIKDKHLLTAKLYGEVKIIQVTEK